ncbi:InlB B-repeat-containing protein [Algoriphagus confluentis]|uniref:Bacterial repeat domain-containing protein n=1 Tax=Algoriphagus confluentis TaxID=1697556 RepID=A0ABQ6PR70_9BACT|nr:hypothetical protein Aconfl_31140 [Algoriphagus confluentis]
MLIPKKTFQLISFSISILLLFISCESEEPIPSYSLSTLVSPPNSGKIEAPSSTIRSGETVILTAIAEPNWVFTQWEGDALGNANPLSVAMNSDKTITGIFVKREYPLTLTVEGEGTVEEKLIINTAGREYPHGSIVELTPKPKEGWAFAGWSGDASGTSSPLRVTVEKSTAITATFVLASPLALFGGSQDDVLSKVITTAQGKYLLVGTTASNDGVFEGLHKGGMDAFVIQLHADLSLDWVRVFGGSGDDTAASVIQNMDGSYSVTGTFNSINGDFSGLLRGESDVFHIKLDQNGNTSWIRTFGNARTHVVAKSLIEDQIGISVVLATADGECCNGFSGGNSYRGGKDMVMIFIDQSGNLLQVVNYGTSQDDDASVLYRKKDGNLIILGTRQPIGTENKEDLVVISTDRSGSQLSSALYRGSGSEVGFDVIEPRTSSELIVVGTTTSMDGDFSYDGYGKSNIFLLRLASFGLGIGGIAVFGGNEHDYGTALLRFPNSDDIYILGSSDSHDLDSNGGSVGGSDLVLIKSANSFNQKWIKTYGGSGNEGFFANPFGSSFPSKAIASITTTPAGGLLLAGSTESNDLLFDGLNRGKKDIFIIRTDAAGVVK